METAANLREALSLLEERLAQHDSNRREVQDKLQEICTKELEGVLHLEENINKEIHTSFNKTEESILGLIEKLKPALSTQGEEGEEEEGNNLDNFILQAEEELSSEQKYIIELNRRADNFGDSHKLKIYSINTEKENTHKNSDNLKDKIGSIITKLQEHLNTIRESMKTAQNELTEICTKRREKVESLKKRINDKLESLFVKEDSRIQEAVNLIRTKIDIKDRNELNTLMEKARSVLFTSYKYLINDLPKRGSLDDYDLTCKQNVHIKYIVPEEIKPFDIQPTFTDIGEVSISFKLFDSAEDETLKLLNLPIKMELSMWEKDHEGTSKVFIQKGVLGDSVFTFFVDSIGSTITYSLKVRIEYKNSFSKWSDEYKEFITPDFSTCVWKKCPFDELGNIAYFIKANKRVAYLSIYAHENYKEYEIEPIDYHTLVMNTPLMLSKVISWNIKILESKGNNGEGIYIGVAPFGIKQNEDETFHKCGWYFHCYNSSLHSGPPHNYRNKGYGPIKLFRKSVCTGDSIGVVMDTTFGELSFAVNDKSYGLAYSCIPLDRPLVPCVILENKGDSVEFDLSEVKSSSAIKSSNPTLSNITVKGSTWDTITLTWNAVKKATLYQIEVDGSVFWGASTTNVFTKEGLLPETEHSFRVRTVLNHSVSEWSGVVKGKTQKESFGMCVWRGCPACVDDKRKYFVDESNPRIATKIGNNDGYSTIIGNTPLPLNKVTSWNVKLLKSRGNNGGEIYIGVAPYDINQNDDSYDKCGWYFYCSELALCSGPPHDYRKKNYMPLNTKETSYTVDYISVMMDTAKGDLSFSLNEIDFGVGYEEIPLDKPLAPCVILRNKGDSIELNPSKEKSKEVGRFISELFITGTKSDRCDTITITWNPVEDAQIYQVEIDESKVFGVPQTKNTFTKTGLLPDTEHSFRVRAMVENSLSEWCGVVKGRTQKESFETSFWKESPIYVDERMKYSVDENNPKIATKVSGNYYCTIVGNSYILLNKVTSWSIKILKSKGNDGNGIYVGVAPFDIARDEKINFVKCGWYFYCYDFKLYSGLPHGYNRREYGPRRENEHVCPGGSVGVVMDTTTKGVLSFVVNGVKHGDAYEGIPLDRPLVPCVIMKYEGDSIELDTSEVRGNEVVNDDNLFPSLVTVDSTTWSSIKLTWDANEEVSSYQVEVDGEETYKIRDFFNLITIDTNDGDDGDNDDDGDDDDDDDDDDNGGIQLLKRMGTFTKGGFLPETEHSFRIRLIKDNSVSEWSEVVKGKTQKESFETSFWKDCPEYVDKEQMYKVSESDPRYATKSESDGLSTVITNAYLPPSKVTSWNFMITRSKNRDGKGIFMGVAPFDIDQYENDNLEKCGWYFDCCDLLLCSGPPHNYRNKARLPKPKYQYHSCPEDGFMLTMNTIRGDLSLLFDGVDFGVIYEGIPLDKPLVPCALLKNLDDSVSFNFNMLKKKINFPNHVDSSTISKVSYTWDSISLAWGDNYETHFYQIEVSGNKIWGITKTNTFAQTGLLPDTEYNVRVRAVREHSMSGWSDFVKIRTQEKSFVSSGWKECPDDVDENGRYSFNGWNPRIATKTAGNDRCCTIVGNTPLPLDKVISWNVKLTKSRYDGGGFNIGVAPFNIDQNEDNIYSKCGWFYYCYSSTLWSGPPHKYADKEYGPRKENGKYVHELERVGLEMDTAKGVLSFSINGNNLGVAYEGIPLDEPLVPCVLMKYEGDSVELVIPK